MEWNPKTHDYCHGCCHYEPTGDYVYQLQSNPAKRKCKHLARCGRVANFLMNADFGVQMSLGDLTEKKKG